MIELFEGFETYGGSSTVPDAMRSKWDVNDAKLCTPDFAGRNFGYAMQIGMDQSAGTHDYITTPIFTSAATWLIGFGFYRDTGSEFYEAIGNVLYLRNGTATAGRLCRNAKSWSLQNGVGSTLHTWSVGVDDDHDTWHYVELKVTVAGSSSSAELRIDGLSLGATSTVTLSQASANNFRWEAFDGSATDGRHYALDDIVIQSGTVSFLGPCSVEAVMPSGVGTNSDWTPSAGANWECVDEAPDDGSASYVSSVTPGAIDSYAFGDLTELGGEIHAVQMNAVGYENDANLRLYHRHAGSYVSSDGPYVFDAGISTVWTVKEYSTGTTPWTVASVNAAEFGLKVEE